MELNGNISNGNGRIECPTYEKLKPNHQKFVDCLAKGQPQYKAYKNAIYTGNKATVSYDTLSSSASNLIRNHNIRTALEERCRILAMGRQEAIQRMSDFARGTPGHFVRVGYEGELEIDLSTDNAKNNIHLIKKIKQKKTIKAVSTDEESGEIIEVYDLHTEIEMYSAADATAKIMRARGHFSGTMENPGVQVQMTLEEWREEARKRREGASASMDNFEEKT